MVTLGGIDSGAYVLIDDRTGKRTRIVPPWDCELWNRAFGPPWALFGCNEPVPGSNGSGLALYNVVTHSWRGFPCGEPCKTVGVAAPQGLGSHWLEMNEDAYCDIRYFPCDEGIVYVSVPSATTTRRYTPSSRTILDLNSPSLVRRVCSPLRDVVATYGEFAVTEQQTGDYLGRCGSNLHIPLATIASGNPRPVVQGNAHAVIACDDTKGQYSGIYLPSLRRFTFSLPGQFPGCNAQLGDRTVYVSGRTRAWAAPFPLEPLPTYASCPANVRRTPTSTTPGAGRRLVPTGATAVLLCRYRQTAGRPVAHALITASARVKELARRFDALAMPSGTLHCPSGTGRRVLAFFRYRAAPDDPVTVQLDGCRLVSNGRVTRTAATGAGPGLVRELGSLTR